MKQRRENDGHSGAQQFLLRLNFQKFWPDFCEYPPEKSHARRCYNFWCDDKND